MIFKSFLPPVTKRHVERKILATPVHHLFRIVADVDSYSSFLPLCSFSRILKRWPVLLPGMNNNIKNNNNKDCKQQKFEAQLTVGLPPFFQETYTSLVVADPIQFTIESKSIQSQNIDSLTSLWQMKQINHMEEGQQQQQQQQYYTDVQLEVSMTVRDPVIVAALERVLEGVARQQVAAFSKRCLEIPIQPE